MRFTENRRSKKLGRKWNRFHRLVTISAMLPFKEKSCVTDLKDKEARLFCFLTDEPIPPEDIESLCAQWADVHDHVANASLPKLCVKLAQSGKEWHAKLGAAFPVPASYSPE